MLSKSAGDGEVGLLAGGGCARRGKRQRSNGLTDISKMRKGELVTGMVINSDEQPDVICEPCLAGKMHSNPFPPSPNRALHPLELIHSDLHGPLPVQTCEGYRYWITFIDDCTSFRAAMLLRKKSDAFHAFRTFKAYAENQLSAKIKALFSFFFFFFNQKFIPQCSIAVRVLDIREYKALLPTSRCY